MNIPRINAYASNVKNCGQRKNATSFRKKYPNTGWEIDPCNQRINSTLIRGVPYKTVMTYKEIMALKDFADSFEVKGERPNVAVRFVADCVGDWIGIKKQDDMMNDNVKWTDISDVDAC